MVTSLFTPFRPEQAYRSTDLAVHGPITSLFRVARMVLRNIPSLLLRNLRRKLSGLGGGGLGLGAGRESSDRGLTGARPARISCLWRAGYRMGVRAGRQAMTGACPGSNSSIDPAAVAEPR